MALVSAQPLPSSPSSNSSQSPDPAIPSAQPIMPRQAPKKQPRDDKGKKGEKISDMGQDVDMRRATDLVELHYGVKMKHAAGGEDQGLRQARKNVEAVLQRLKRV